MSHDHKPDSAKEKNRIYKCGGWVGEGRIKGNLNLSRSLGDFEYKQDKKDKKNKENDFYKYLDPKNSEDCDIASITGCTACVAIIDEKFKRI